MNNDDNHIKELKHLFICSKCGIFKLFMWLNYTNICVYCRIYKKITGNYHKNKKEKKY